MLGTDLATILGQDFGEPATITDAGGTRAINVMLNVTDDGLEFYGEVEMPEIFAQVSSTDVPLTQNGDTLVIGGATYYILSVHRELDGVTNLELSEDA